jgi:hypothetical protein
MAVHVKVVAGLLLALGAFFTLGAFFSTALFGVLATVAGLSGDDGGRVGSAVLGFTGIVVTIFALTLAIPSLACGWGLLKLRRWARVGAIVLAAICLIEFPVGTMFGVYTLWVLFNRNTERLFREAGGPDPL